MKHIRPDQLSSVQGGLRARAIAVTGPNGGQLRALQVRGPYAGVSVGTFTNPCGQTVAFRGARRFF